MPAITGSCVPRLDSGGVVVSPLKVANVMDKVSDKLSALVESQKPEQEVRLNVLLRKGLDLDRIAALANELARLASDNPHVEILPASSIVLINGTLDAVERIADHPAVQWVDQDTESPVKDLLDK